MSATNPPVPSPTPWLRALAATWPSAVASHLPGTPLDRRLRERVLVAVAEANGSASVAWVHGGWRRFLGATDPADADDAVLAWARSCAEAGRPLDPTRLADAVPPAALRALEATVARGQLAAAVGRSGEALLDRVRRRRPLDRAVPRDVATVALGAPLVLPVAAVGAALGWVERAVPALPEVELLDPEPNLLAHLLATSVPAWLSGALWRATVLRAPTDVVVGVKAGESVATVRLGHGRVAVANGIQDDAWVLLEGDGDPLVRAAAGSLGRELRRTRIRPT